MRNFFSRPYEFSFKDLLATGFCSVFLYFCYKALGSQDALGLVKALVPLIGIILGGYFVQESASIWFNRTQGPQAPPTSYQSYPYSYSESPPQVKNNKPTI